MFHFYSGFFVFPSSVVERQRRHGDREVLGPGAEAEAARRVAIHDALVLVDDAAEHVGVLEVPAFADEGLGVVREEVLCNRNLCGIVAEPPGAAEDPQVL